MKKIVQIFKKIKFMELCKNSCIVINNWCTFLYLIRKLCYKNDIHEVKGAEKRFERGGI